MPKIDNVSKLQKNIWVKVLNGNWRTSLVKTFLGLVFFSFFWFFCISFDSTKQSQVMKFYLQ